jgi:hypothetical protein
VADGIPRSQIRHSRTNGDTRPRNTNLPIPCHLTVIFHGKFISIYRKDGANRGAPTSA